MESRREIEDAIRKLVGIPKGYRVSSLIKERVGRWEYYKVFAYKSGRKKGFRVRRRDEKALLSLWKKFEKLRREEEELLEVIRENSKIRDKIRKMVKEV